MLCLLLHHLPHGGEQLRVVGCAQTSRGIPSRSSVETSLAVASLLRALVVTLRDVVEGGVVLSVSLVDQWVGEAELLVQVRAEGSEDTGKLWAGTAGAIHGLG